MALRDIVRTSFFTALTAVGAFLSVPNPLAASVPFTLQVFAIFLAGSLLGPRLGALSQVAYLALGAVGVPVFAGGTGGFAHLFQATGGYLFSFPVMALVVGALAGTSGSWSRLVLANLAAVAVSLLMGGAGLALFGGLSWPAAFSIAIVFIPYDALKAVIAATLAVAVRRAVSMPPAARPGTVSRGHTSDPTNGR